MYLAKRIWNPEIFQGAHKKSRYFEGWYYKIIDSQSRNIFAVIPGVAFGEDGGTHAFVQVADAVGGMSWYFRFPIEDFRYSEDRFEVWIADNYFSAGRIRLHLQNERLKLEGELSFTKIERFPKSLTSPGIMGPFTFIPFMECYHGIVNIHHEIEGSLYVNDSPVDFGGGYGYIEKDWGSSFPEAWIWLQSNHFDRQGVSMMFSIAKIPWMNRHFTGFISFLRLDDRFYKFATYTGAKPVRLRYADGELEAVVKGGGRTLRIKSAKTGGNTLKAPKMGNMDTEISESITAEVEVLLTDKNGEVLFKGLGRNAGLEIAGDVAALLPGAAKDGRPAVKGRQ